MARECPYVILVSFGLYAFYNPTPCPMKLTCRYVFYVELYSGVVLFSLIFRVKVRVRVRVQGLRLGLGLCLATDNLQNILKYLIGGAANTFVIPCPQTPV